MRKTWITAILSMATLVLSAQDTADKKAAMADLMRSNGKIYVVVAVMLTILAGIILYLIRLDRKISRFEKTETQDRK